MKIPFMLLGAEFNVIELEYKPNKRLIFIHHTDGDDIETTILTEIQWNEIKHVSQLNADVELSWTEDTLTFSMSENVELTQHENLQHLVFTQKGWLSVVATIDTMMCSRFKPQTNVVELMTIVEINKLYDSVVFRKIIPTTNNLFEVTSYPFVDRLTTKEIKLLNDKGLKRATKFR